MQYVVQFVRSIQLEIDTNTEEIIGAQICSCKTTGICKIMRLSWGRICRLMTQRSSVSIPDRQEKSANSYSTHKTHRLSVTGLLYTLQYRRNVKRQAGGDEMSSSESSAWRELEQLGPCTPSVSVYSLSRAEDFCLQAVIRQPWGSVKTLYAFHLNCCIHPANWNPATGS